MNLTDHIEDTHQMRQKVENHIEVPDNDIEAYIPYYYIQDDIEHADKTTFCIIFSTEREISFLTKSSHIHRAIVPQLRHLSSLSKDTAKACQT